MLANRSLLALVVGFIALFSLTLLASAEQGGDKKVEQKKEKKKARPNPVYTDVDDPQAPFLCLRFKDIMKEGQNRSPFEANDRFSRRITSPETQIDSKTRQFYSLQKRVAFSLAPSL